MTYTSGAVKLLKSQLLGLPGLAEFDFESGLQRYWTGLGKLTTLDGRMWQGIGNFGSVSDIVTKEGLVAEKITFEIAREAEVDGDLIAIEATEFGEAVRQAMQEEYEGRRCAIYAQVMNMETGECEGSPEPIWAGFMSQPEAEIRPETFAMRISAESLFVEGLDPPHAYLTNVDQQARFPGDLACEFAAELSQRQVNWFG